MNEPSFASLSPTLLARKGGAKPAMRPQNTAGPIDPQLAAASLEDLGWNDMGADDLAHGARVMPIQSGPGPLVDRDGQVEPSPVRDTIARIARKLEAPAAKSPAIPAVPAATPSGRKAAFTLRLDPQRHLRLRLACTVEGKSAQVLVTQALDAMLADMPEIDKLAAEVARD